MGPLLNRGGELVTADTDKAEVFGGFFAFLTNKPSHSSVLRAMVQRKLPAVERIRDYLREFDWKAPWDHTDHVQGAERTG